MTARTDSGDVIDVSRLAKWEALDEQRLMVDPGGYVQGLADGQAEVLVQYGNFERRIPVTIRNAQDDRRVSFRRELVPVLSAAGCSDIRCHGAPQGKNGFRLSLWGFDPELDHRQLTHAGQARRTNAMQPENSLIFRKATARIPHVGGRRFKPESGYADVLRAWQSEGMRDDHDTVPLTKLRVTPGKRVLHSPAHWQQLRVEATFADGTVTDVTRRATYFSSDLAVANVDRDGFVRFQAQGEAAILCRYLGRMESVRLMHVAKPRDGFAWTSPPENNDVDRHVFAKLRLMNIVPSPLCSDEEFVRRLYLDLCGVLPTPGEAVERDQRFEFKRPQVLFSRCAAPVAGRSSLRRNLQRHWGP